MGFLAILPVIWDILKTVGGSLFTETAQTSIISKVLSGGISSAGGLMGVITEVMGGLSNEQIATIKAKVDVAVAQTQVIQSDTKSNSWFASWHAMFCWSMSAIVIIHCGTAEILNQLISWHLANVGLLAPLDTATYALIGTVLGGSMLGKAVENVNSNKDQSHNADDDDDK